ncbi:thioesterase [Massilia forsythiae]|uniref:Thioesterase n=1 Tax=Massilia forsythiae TaxID=2728020 RepID=A0A7Z2VY06_9BURK|nr:alpha/beta fold hydrolase [Massilia forsythiae]QJE01538.1 thioesterase [Massilia forsythiae]
MNTLPWILRHPMRTPRLRLFCFCYAGGNAIAYLPWQAGLGLDIEVCAVQLPGRGARTGEAPFSCMESLMRALMPVVGALDELPFAFFGHSLGAMVAFELARRLQGLGLAQPEHLIVSGCAAPRHRKPPRQLHLLPADALIETLREYNGTPHEILAHRELMDLLLPTIRADFALVETYRYQEAPLLALPLTVLAGRSDDATGPASRTQWQRETLGPCRIEWFEGDHFFINDAREAVLAVIRAALLHEAQAQVPSH